jgi:hypothetical protein
VDVVFCSGLRLVDLWRLREWSSRGSCVYEQANRRLTLPVRDCGTTTMDAVSSPRRIDVRWSITRDSATHHVHRRTTGGTELPVTRRLQQSSSRLLKNSRAHFARPALRLTILLCSKMPQSSAIRGRAIRSTGPYESHHVRPSAPARTDCLEDFGSSNCTVRKEGIHTVDDSRSSTMWRQRSRGLGTMSEDISS